MPTSDGTAEAAWPSGENITDDEALFGMYLADVAHCVPLTPIEEAQLGALLLAGQQAAAALARVPNGERPALARCADQGREARTRLAEANVRLVISIAKRYKGRGLPLGDLVQCGNIGLMQAIDKWEPQRGLRFSTYATWWIRQAVLRGLYAERAPIRVPRHMLYAVIAMRDAFDALAQELGREPNLHEIAAHLGVQVGRLSYALAASRVPVSLSGLGYDGDDSNDLGIVEMIEDPQAVEPEAVAMQRAYASLVGSLVDELPARERVAVCQRYGLAGEKARTLTDIGVGLGVSGERARQLERQGRLRLRHHPQVEEVAPVVFGMVPTLPLGTLSQSFHGLDE